MLWCRLQAIRLMKTSTFYPRNDLYCVESTLNSTLLYPTLPYVDDWADHACCQQRSLSAIQISVCWNSEGGGVVGSKLAIILRSAFYVRWCYQIFHLSSDVHFPSLQHAIFSCWCCCRVAGKEIVCMNSEQCARILWIVHKTCIVGFDTKASSNID